MIHVFFLFKNVRFELFINCKLLIYSVLYSIKICHDLYAR